MHRHRTTTILLIAIAVAVSLSSCVHLFGKRSKKPAATNQSMYAVKTEKTPFYRYGPQQAGGPDRDLPRDTVVTAIRQSMGYTKIRLEDGQQGFVASEDLVRAPEKLLAHADNSGPDRENLPPPPSVHLPVADPASPEFEPTPLPQPLLP